MRRRAARSSADFARADAGDLAAVEAVLLEPDDERGGTDAELGRRLVLTPADTDQRDPSTKLRRIGTGHLFSRPMKAVT